MQKALVLSADKWELTDEKTGEIRRGLSVWYINDYREPTDKFAGFKPSKVTADFESFAALAAANLPAFCEMEYGSRTGAEGKATLVLVGIKPIKSVSLTEKKAA